jgi:hypothetical protein
MGLTPDRFEPKRLLEDWLDSHRTALAAGGIEQDLEAGPADRPKSCAWLNLTGEAGIGQLILWSSGECDLLVLSRTDRGQLLNEHMVIGDIDDVDKALGRLTKLL